MAPLKICGHMAYQEFKISFKQVLAFLVKLQQKRARESGKNSDCEIVFAERFKGWNYLGFL